jgi:hypothetical protein
MVTSSDVVTFARHAVGAPPFYMLAFGGVARMPAQLPSSSTGTVACPELGRALSREGLALRHEGHLPFAEPAFCASRTQLRVDGLHRSFEIRPYRRLCSFLRRGTRVGPSRPNCWSQITDSDRNTSSRRVPAHERSFSEESRGEDSSSGRGSRGRTWGSANPSDGFSRRCARSAE